jgi:hypothetical protein
MPFILCAQQGLKENAASFQQNNSLCFIENKGQITDQFGKPRKDIQYKLNGNGLNVFIGNGRIHYQFTKSVQKNNRTDFKNILLSVHRTLDTTRTLINTYRIDVSLIDANKNAKLIAEEPQNYSENYYLPQCGTNGATAHSFNKLTYKNIYPGIDWVLYIKDNKLEYDFILYPGADPSKIQLQYLGPKKLSLSPSGDLEVNSPLGNFSEQKPIAYEQETGKTINSHFSLNNNILSFTAEKYNGTLVIDPKLEWATYYNILLEECSITCDHVGNLFAIGNTTSGSYNVATSGSFQTAFYGYGDIFISKFNSSGVRKWSTYYGGGHSKSTTLPFTAVGGIVCDAIGNVYFTGWTTCDTGIATSGSHQDTIAGWTDAILIKLDSLGKRKWATYYGGNNYNSYTAGWCVACDKQNNIYLWGGTNATNGIASSGAFQTSSSGGLAPYTCTDCFLAKFDSAGNWEWGTYYGGNSAENPSGITIDVNNNVYVSGSTFSDTNIATLGSFQDTCDGGSYGCAFFAKFNSSGQRKWASYFGAATTYIADIAADYLGNLYITGLTQQKTKIATVGAFQTSFTGNASSFLTQFDTLGNRRWATYYGGFNYGTLAYALNCDSENHIFFGGYTYDTSNIATPGAFKTTIRNNLNPFGFVAEFSSLGRRLWGTYYGGDSATYIFGITSDPMNNIFLGGYTASHDSISTSGSFQPNFDTTVPYNPKLDGFIAKFSRDTNITIRQPYVDTVFCPGATWRVAYKVDYQLQSGNVFTAQLSDSVGSFNAPVNIGSITSTVSDTITCTIPSSAHTGNGYRIRVVSNSPVIIGTDDYYNIHIVSGITSLTAINNGPVCAGTSLQLSATASPFGAKYSWTGPGGITNPNRNFSLTPATVVDSGRYYVSVTAPGCNSLIDSTTAVVRIIPATPIVSANSLLCASDSLLLAATDSNSGVGWHWSGPAGFTSSFQNPHLSPFVAGKYWAWVSLNNCNSPADTINVTTKYTPSKPVLSSNSPVCTGDTLLLYASDTSSVVTYYWFGPSGFTSGSKDTFIVPALNGLYKARAVAANGCASFFDSITAVVKLRPASPAIFANKTICKGDTLHLHSSDTSSSVLYYWSGPSFMAYIADTLLASPLTGTYFAWVTASNGCVSAKDSVNVIVNPLPPLPNVFANSPVCSDTALKLSASDSVAPVTYHWSGPASFTSSLQSVVVMPPVAGGYITWVTDTNNCSSDKVITLITVRTSPAKPSIIPIDSICSKDTLYLHATDTTAGVQFHWLTPLGIYSLPDPVFYPVVTPGLYIVSVGLNGCNSGYDTANIVVQPSRLLSVTIATMPRYMIYPITIDTFIAIVQNGGASPRYQWKLNGVDIPGANADTLISWKVTSSDVINVVVHGSDICTDPVSAEATTGPLNKIHRWGSDFILYPIPNDGNFYVKGLFNGVTYKDAPVAISNVIGQFIYTGKLDIINGVLFQQYSLGNALADGMYYFHIIIGGEDHVVSFQILH